MLDALRKWWNYLAVKLGMKLEETADPKVQLEQAIQEARAQHLALTTQAANVIANQKQLEARLERSMDEYQKANASARQALVLADKATQASDAAQAASMSTAAEAYATRVIRLRGEIEEQERALLGAVQASEQARQAVATNSVALQKSLSEREALLSKLDQAKMQEQLNSAMAQLNASVGEEAPTFDEIRTKIDRRLATAQATSELTGASVDATMLQVEIAQRSSEAQTLLGEMRGELGLPEPGGPTVTIEPAPQAALSPGPAEDET